MPIKGNDIYIDIYKIKGENADQAEIAVRKDTKLLIIAIVLGKQLCEYKGWKTTNQTTTTNCTKQTTNK